MTHDLQMSAGQEEGASRLPPKFQLAYICHAMAFGETSPHYLMT
jgi:hypothetical protein